VTHVTFRRFFFRGLRERDFRERVGSGTEPGGGLAREQSMIQQTRQWRSSNGETAWLSALVETMREVSRPKLRSVPCDAALLKAARAHLARPSSPYGFYGSTFSFRN
jgi:hypothetical protein